MKTDFMFFGMTINNILRKIKKYVKKIGAVAGSALMVGLTMGSA